jgi:hypothetical protein
MLLKNKKPREVLIMDFKNLIAINGDQSNNEMILGQLLYMTLGSMLIKREDMQDIFEVLGIDEKYMPRKLQYTDAFRSATTEIATRLNVNGKYIKLYMRDNLKDKSKGIISRELVKEIVGWDNYYTQVGKFKYDTENKTLSYELADYDSDISVYQLQELADKVEALFELYKESFNRNSVETIINNLLGNMDTSKVTQHGKLYFVPRYKLNEVTILEEFGEMLNEKNHLVNMGVNYTPATINAIFVINDEKQRKNFEQSFYTTVQKELELYQNRLTHFINNGSKSEKIIGRWLEKIKELNVKKKKYENLFSKNLDKLNDEFENVEFLAMELQMRFREVSSFNTGTKPMDGQIGFVAA